MKTFTYDEVVGLMSQCLDNLEERISLGDHIEIIDYDLSMYDHRVEIDGANFNCDELYDEISIDFKDRLDDLVKYKESSISLK